MVIADRAVARRAAASGALVVLALMFLFNVMNFLDRMLFAILQEPIKRDLGLTDTQLGLLAGPAFAILYAVVALPMGRIADRHGRVRVIAAVLTLWSVMTAACGLASSFAQIALGRVGVSVGEAGCAPAAHSLISNYYPPERRAGAIAVFTSGTSIGTLTAAFGGAALAHAYGWRTAFLLCGVGGVILALIIATFVREPVEQGSVGRGSAGAEHAGLTAVAAVLLRKPTYRHLCAGMALATLSGFAGIQYLTSFLIRIHHLPLTTAAAITGVMVGGVGFFAALGFGFAVDRGRRRYPRLQMTLPAVAVTTGAIGYCVLFSTSNLGLALFALFFSILGNQSFLGSGFALAQDLSPAPARSTASGLLMLIVGLVGFGVGPPIVGLISDLVASQELAGSGLTVTACAHATASGICAAAQAHGLRIGLLAATLPMFWAALHFWFASKTMQRDVVPSGAGSPL